MSHSCENGWVLPTTLFGVTLILAALRLLAVDQTGVSQMYGDIRRAHALRQHGIGEILSAGEPKPSCETRDVKIEENTLSYEVCGERRLPFMVAPATGNLPISRIDFDAIFAHATHCPSSPSNAPKPFAAAPTSSKDCVVPSSLEGGIITRENIRGETALVLGRMTQSSTIASPGGISFSGALTLESDLILVAGGDIEIGELTASPQQTRRVTIISALGSVRVASVASGVSVIAAGRATIAVPETRQSPPYPIPPQRGHEIVGIRAVGE